MDKKLLKTINDPNFVITAEYQRMLDFPKIIKGLSDEEGREIVRRVHEGMKGKKFGAGGPGLTRSSAVRRRAK